MTIEDFDALPRRVFLDSCTVQTMLDYGGFVAEGESIAADDRIRSIPGGLANLRALRWIFEVNERALFQWIISDSNLDEIARKSDPAYLRWAYDVLDHTSVCLEESGGATPESDTLARRLDEPRFGYLGVGDRRLIQDAVLLRCDAFLTMERRLPRNAEHLRREIGIRVLTPAQHWDLLRPWAALYR